MIDRSAFPRRRHQAGIGGHLASIVEVAVERFGPQSGGDLRADALQLRQHHCWRWGHFARGLDQGVRFRLDDFPLIHQQLDPIEFPADLRLQVRWQGTAISRLEGIHALTSAAKEGVAIKHALRTEKALDPVGMLDALGKQVFEFVADPPPHLSAA